MPVGEVEGKNACAQQVNSHKSLIGSFIAVKSNTSLTLEVGQSTCLISLLFGEGNSSASERGISVKPASEVSKGNGEEAEEEAIQKKLLTGLRRKRDTLRLY